MLLHIAFQNKKKYYKSLNFASISTFFSPGNADKISHLTMTILTPLDHYLHAYKAKTQHFFMIFYLHPYTQYTFIELSHTAICQYILMVITQGSCILVTYPHTRTVALEGRAGGPAEGLSVEGNPPRPPQLFFNPTVFRIFVQSPPSYLSSLWEKPFNDLPCANKMQYQTPSPCLFFKSYSTGIQDFFCLAPAPPYYRMT